MLLASGIKWHFWNETVMTANYLKNRSPTSAFGKQFFDKTPAEIWYGNKPDLSNVRIFGSTCYNFVPPVNRKKLDAKSSKCIMLGYGSSMHTCRLWNVDAGKLVIGRHITFNEGSVMNRSKTIEITDTEAVIEPINGFGGDKIPDNPFETTDDEFTDANDTTLNEENVHDVTDDIGNNENGIHGANGNCIGNDKKGVHGATDGTGNIDLRRSQRERKPVQRYGDWEYDAHFALSAQQYVQDDPISIEDAKRRIDWSNWKRTIDDE